MGRRARTRGDDVAVCSGFAWLSGAMVCSLCGGSIVKVSGKSGGYYGCLGAARNACENRLLVRRSLTERVILAAVRDKLASDENLAYVLERVKAEITRLTSTTRRRDG